MSRRQSSVVVMQNPNRRSMKRYSFASGMQQTGNGATGQLTSQLSSSGGNISGYRRASRPSLSAGMLGLSGPLLNPSESVTTMGAVDTDSILQTLATASSRSEDCRPPSESSSNQVATIPEDAELEADDVDVNVFETSASELPEEHRGQEVHAIPLDPSKLEKMPGYENVGYHRTESTTYIRPPEVDEMTEAERPEETYLKVKLVGSDEAQELLLNSIVKRCCFGTSAARDMVISNISADSVFQYRLETFTEYRSATWEYEPFTGQSDDMDDGPIPLPLLPWEIPFRPSQDFRDEVNQIEVPNTTSILPCHGCNGQGLISCNICLGRSYLRCMTCQGSGKLWKADLHGHRRVESCWHCRGIGRKKCGSCGHNGRVACQTCKGYRQVRCFIRMTIKFVNHVFEHVIKSSDIPETMVKKGDSQMILEQVTKRAWPLRNHPDIEVRRLSSKAIEDHFSEHSANGRILAQRQQLYVVPLTRCTYVWQDKEYQFWIYGKDTQVYCPGYPQRYCWGCIVL